ncbi:uncharacterized protein LOC133204933 [Saccostrea echinata]|uniref:uncharacterized protein LOC133204933 n=1 Tax=Saccostrea echinata TaxID=191078 RepID=UPI002A81E4CB|nr:uncharacterized protein LOC133204933 [Saccostrea echinata]
MSVHSLTVSVLVSAVVFANELGWMKWDAYDELEYQFRSVTGENCRSHPFNDLRMPEDVLTQIPKYNELRSKVFYKNRTNLIHLHNMALNRAFYYSYIFQRLNKSEAFQYMPDIHYMHFSVSADLNANPVLNGSALYFDQDCYYPNWVTNHDFNHTLPLFAPKAWRWDDTFDTSNFLREPTLTSVFILDAGSGINRNYTRDEYRSNPWYHFWLPDTKPTYDSTRKYTWSVNLKFSNVTGFFTQNTFEGFNFFGPNNPGTNDPIDRLPVRFTRPYFDCGKSNKWVVSAVSPIADFMPRYSNWTHLRRPRFIGVTVMDTYFEHVDFNACDVSDGNPGPSYLAGTHRCKEHSKCKHLSGFGFHRGGYTCKCTEGYRYPNELKHPYLGTDIEESTWTEYQENFNCTPTDHLNVPPIVDNLESVSIEFSDEELNIGSISRRSVKSSYIPDSLNFDKRSSRRQKRSNYDRPLFDPFSYDRVMKIYRHKSSVTGVNCKTMPPSNLILPGDVGYGVNDQFKYQASMALRLAHFLSVYTQHTEDFETFGRIKGGARLHYEKLFGEVLANVMSDYKILSSGIFFERYVYHSPNESVREYFGPLAFKKDGEFYVIDTAGLDKHYTSELWYSEMKFRWNTNTEHLKIFHIRSEMRSDTQGTSSLPHEHSPLGYKAPTLEQGLWMPPKFKCDGRIDAWVMTYVVPFFRRKKLSNNIQFAGVVTVDVPLDLLEINPCPQPFHVQNAFKNTARCHTQSTTCRPIEGFRFSRTAYACDCRQGFEYPFKDGKRWIAGSLLELEYEKKRRGLFSRCVNSFNKRYLL